MSLEELPYESPDQPSQEGTSQEEELLVFSQGDSTLIEGKKRIKNNHVSQLISTTIVTSFTEYNRHPNLNSAILCILINATTAYVAIYDYHLDILLLSTAIEFQLPDGTIDTNMAFILWLAINHRYDSSV